jgi:hypothetical protein
MNPTDERMEHYRQLGEQELLRLYRSGGLTELAREQVAAELRRRLIEPPEPPTAARAAPAGNAGPLTTVGRMLDPVQAQLVQALLQSEGIPCFIADQQTVQTNPLWTMLVGGVRLQVPQALAGQAREVIAAMEQGRYALDEDAAPEDRQG